MPFKPAIVPASAPPPAERVRQRIKRMPKPAEMLQCHRCGSRETFETKTGVLFQAGKTRGGTKQLCCAACWLKGERVVVA